MQDEELMSRPKGGTIKVRLNIELSDVSRTTLDRLRKETNADSLVEVVKRALNIYDYVHTASKAGERIVIKYANGEEKEVIFL